MGARILLLPFYGRDVNPYPGNLNPNVFIPPSGKGVRSRFAHLLVIGDTKVFPSPNYARDTKSLRKRIAYLSA